MLTPLLFTGNPPSPSEAAMLTDRGFEVEFAPGDLSEHQLIDALQGKEAYILGGIEKVTAAVLAQAKSLRVVAFLGVGYQAHIDASAAATYGIAVTNAPGANALSVAEFAVGLLLDAVRGLTHAICEAKSGRAIENPSWTLRDKVIGIVGLGTIGTQVARIAAQGFAMKVVYHSRTRKPHLETEFDAQYVGLADLLSVADVITVHVPFSLDTTGMIGDAELATVKPTAVLINTSRPELVDAPALYRALRDNRLAAAAMDNYYIEPIPTPDGDPYNLLTLPHNRFLLSPGIAYYTADAMHAMLEMNVGSILNILAGRPDPYVVNPSFRDPT
jgi:gluconate 2-dehydrogenase